MSRIVTSSIITSTVSRTSCDCGFAGLWPNSYFGGFVVIPSGWGLYASLEGWHTPLTRRAALIRPGSTAFVPCQRKIQLLSLWPCSAAASILSSWRSCYSFLVYSIEGEKTWSLQNQFFGVVEVLRGLAYEPILGSSNIRLQTWVFFIWHTSLCQTMCSTLLLGLIISIRQKLAAVCYYLPPQRNFWNVFQYCKSFAGYTWILFKI